MNLSNRSLKKSSLLAIYVTAIFLAFHVAIPAYINSSFLEEIVSSRYVGLIYSIGALITILGFFLVPFVLKTLGNYRTMITLVCLEMIAFGGLAFIYHPVMAIIFFLIYLVTVPFIYFSLDIFLEGFSTDLQTGRIRGTILTLGNFAWIFSPLISGFILEKGNYHSLYLLALVLLFPVLFLCFNLSHFKDSKYHAVPILSTITEIWKNKDLSSIFVISFLLRFFYSWMIIYTPIYLHQNMGFSWSSIGIIFSIMLIPFVLTEYPLGKLADSKYGEKEMLVLGFIIIGVSTALLSIFNFTSLIWWAILLFITRIGASLIEIMSETYFFKKVDEVNANTISFFRISGPLAYVLGPLVGTILISLLDLPIRYLFLVLGLIMFTGITFSQKIKDTR